MQQSSEGFSCLCTQHRAAGLFLSLAQHITPPRHPPTPTWFAMVTAVTGRGCLLQQRTTPGAAGWRKIKRVIRAAIPTNDSTDSPGGRGLRPSAPAPPAAALPRRLFLPQPALPYARINKRGGAPSVSRGICDELFCCLEGDVRTVGAFKVVIIVVYRRVLFSPGFALMNLNIYIFTHFIYPLLSISKSKLNKNAIIWD